MTLPILYFTYSFATRSSASLCVNHWDSSAYHIILSVYHGFNIMLIILIMNLLTNFITILMIPT